MTNLGRNQVGMRAEGITGERMCWAEWELWSINPIGKICIDNCRCVIMSSGYGTGKLAYWINALEPFPAEPIRTFFIRIGT